MGESVKTVFGLVVAFGAVGTVFAVWEKVTAPSYWTCALDPGRYRVTSLDACNNLADSAGTYLVPCLIVGVVALVALVILSRRTQGAEAADSAA